MISFTSEQRFIVTGASSGIGEGVALLLNELGATVIGIGRNQERLEGMKAKAKHPENVFLEQKDLAEDIPGLPAYVKALKEKYGKFHGMAYCAGMGDLSPLQMWDVERSQHIFTINYFAPIAMLKGILDRRNNVGKGASCVMLASAAANMVERGHVSYAGSKAALIASVRCVAKECAQFGIRLNSVSPTLILTPMSLAAGEEYIKAQEVRYPMGAGTVEDVANFVVYLLSDRAKWITAQNYIVDCGVM